MSKKEMKQKMSQMLVKHNRDMLDLPAKVAMSTGIEYVTLKGRDSVQGINFEEEYVPIKGEDVELIYNTVRQELNEVHLDELTYEQVKKLEKQIVMGSCYTADYENSFGVDPNEVADYAEGYLDAKADGEYDEFYDYICSVEYNHE